MSVHETAEEIETGPYTDVGLLYGFDSPEGDIVPESDEQSLDDRIADTEREIRAKDQEVVKAQLALSALHIRLAELKSQRST